MENVKVVCVFCNSPQSAKIEAEIFGISSGCDTCGYGEGARGEIKVHCENCGKLIYKKEFDETC